MGTPVEWISAPIDSLTPHPQNYRKHPEEQLAHIRHSIEQHGFYRNVVVASDHTILAGHGVVEAARQLGLDEVPVRRLDIASDDARALQVLAGDNELPRLAKDDADVLAGLLSEIRDSDLADLLGTGYDDEDLNRLLLTTGTGLAPDDIDALWGGMPEFASGDGRLHVTVNFATEEDRVEFARRLDVAPDDLNKQFWWPARQRDDSRSVTFQDA